MAGRAPAPVGVGTDPSDGVATIDVAIVGGGISGLAAALRLHEATPPERPPVVRLLEASSRFGGVLRSELRDGFLFEAGADSMVTQKPAGLELCGRLGLEGELLEPLTTGPGTSVLHGRRLVPLPDGFQMMVPTRLGPLLRSPLFSPAGKARLLAERFVPARAKHPGTAEQDDDETLRGFVERRFGRELYDRVVEPLFGGLFTADADRLSLALTAARFRDLETRFGSVTRGLLAQSAAAPPGPRGGGARPRPAAGVVTLASGMEQLVRAIVSRLPDGWLEADAPVAQLALAGDPAVWSLELGGGRRLLARALVLACPAFAAAELMSPLDGALAEGLRGLEYTSCATVSLAYRRDQVRAPLEGLGFFVPRGTDLEILACSYTSEKFSGRSPGDCHLFRVFMGGALAPELLERDDAELAAIAHRDLAGLLDIDGGPQLVSTRRQERAMPQFRIGVPAKLGTAARRAAELPGLFLCGGSVGAYGVPDCVRSGETAATSALEHLAREVPCPAPAPGQLSVR